MLLPAAILTVLAEFCSAVGADVLLRVTLHIVESESLGPGWTNQSYSQTRADRIRTGFQRSKGSVIGSDQPGSAAASSSLYVNPESSDPVLQNQTSQSEKHAAKILKVLDPGLDLSPQRSHPGPNETGLSLEPDPPNRVQLSKPKETKAGRFWVVRIDPGRAKTKSVWKCWN